MQASGEIASARDAGYGSRVPFDYYKKLSARQQATYRKSDAVTDVQLSDVRRSREAARKVESALATEKPAQVQKALAALGDVLARDLSMHPVQVKVLARRPSRHAEELHGLYVREEGKTAQITVWMKTAQHRNVVRYRTFLRTYLHELCHHIDFEKLKLRDTFHTEGFFKRESSLMRQLAPRPPKKPARPESKGRTRSVSTKKRPTREPRPRKAKKPPATEKAPSPRPADEQLSLFDD